MPPLKGCRAKSKVKTLNVEDVLSDLPEELRKELEPFLDVWPESSNRRVRKLGRSELQVRVVNGQIEFPPMSPADLEFLKQVYETIPKEKPQYTEW